MVKSTMVLLFYFFVLTLLEGQAQRKTIDLTSPEVEQIATIGKTEINVKLFNDYLSKIISLIPSSRQLLYSAEIKTTLSKLMVADQMLSNFLKENPVVISDKEFSQARDIFQKRYPYLPLKIQSHKKLEAFLNKVLSQQVAFVKYQKSIIPEISKEEIKMFLSTHPRYKDKQVNEALMKDIGTELYRRRVRSVVQKAYFNLEQKYEVKNYLEIRLIKWMASEPGVKISGPPKGEKSSEVRGIQQHSNFLLLLI